MLQGDSPGFCTIGEISLWGTKQLSAQTVDEAKLLNKNEKRPLWISWEKGAGSAGVVRVGTGLNPARTESEVMFCADPKFMTDVEHLSFDVDENVVANYRTVCFDGILPRGYTAKTERMQNQPATTTGMFGVEPETGQIFVNTPFLDFETQNVFSIMVEATDGKLTDTTMVHGARGQRRRGPVGAQRLSVQPGRPGLRAHLREFARGHAHWLSDFGQRPGR